MPDLDYLLYRFWWHSRTGRFLRTAGDVLALVGMLALVGLALAKGFYGL